MQQYRRLVSFFTLEPIAEGRSSSVSMMAIVARSRPMMYYRFFARRPVPIPDVSPLAPSNPEVRGYRNDEYRPSPTFGMSACWLGMPRFTA